MLRFALPLLLTCLVLPGHAADCGALPLPAAVCATNTDSPPTSLSIDQQPLKGLKHFYVVVEKLSEDAKTTGLSEESIKTWVELRLRELGLPVINKPSSLWEIYSSCMANLYVNVTAMKTPSLLVYAISVQLHEDVKLRRPPYEVAYGATTWSDGRIGACGASVFVDSAKQDTIGKVDKFANDYLAANPKK